MKLPPLRKMSKVQWVFSALGFVMFISAMVFAWRGRPWSDIAEALMAGFGWLSLVELLGQFEESK